MTPSMVIWSAILLAILASLLEGRRRSKRWAILLMLGILPVCAMQLSNYGIARKQWQYDVEQFRTVPQKLRYGEERHATGTYDAVTDTVSFQLPDRVVVVGPPGLILPPGLGSPRAWIEGLILGVALAAAGYGVGTLAGRIWPPAPPGER